MKKFKIIFGVSCIALIYAIIVITGCEKEGPAGADGTPGVDGNVTCLECHSTASKAQIDLEFVRSQHASGDIAVSYAGGRSSCAKCHSHEGYVEFAETGDVADNFTAPSAWKCSTCHGLHTTFDSTDYAFRLATAVTLLADGTTILDEGNNNVCIYCHQSRKNDSSYDNQTTAQAYTRTFTGDDYAVYVTTNALGPAGTIDYDNGVDTVTITFDVPVANVYISSTHAGPHHSTQGNTWAGVGGITASAGTPYASHSGGCVNCHMGTASGHSFIPESDNCTGCHGDKATEMDAIADRIQAVGEALEAIHAVHYSDVEDEEGWHPLYSSITRAQFQAFWNFMICLEDRSNSAHNPTYVKAMLSEAEATLGI